MPLFQLGELFFKDHCITHNTLKWTLLAAANANIKIVGEMSHQAAVAEYSCREQPSNLEQFSSSVSMQAVIKPLSTVTDYRLIIKAELLLSK